MVNKEAELDKVTGTYLPIKL